MNQLLAPIQLFGANTIPTSILEIAAALTTILCVILAARNRIVSYPVGIVGTILFFFVFWSANLYASALLQLYFLPVQFYGWWFWSRGNHGTAPRISDWSWKTVALFGLAAVAITAVTAVVLKAAMPKQVMPFADVAILAFSVLAQFLLDRRIKKTWYVWGLVNIISIPLYASQGLYLTAITYSVLLVNVFHGHLRWKEIETEQNQYTIEVWETGSRI